MQEKKHRTATCSAPFTPVRTTGALLLLALSTLVCGCSPEKPDEETPAVRQQLDDVQARLDTANQAVEDRLREACGEEDNPDC